METRPSKMGQKQYSKSVKSSKMKRLQNFLKRLREIGYSVTVNWEQKLGDSQTLIQYRVFSKERAVLMVCQVYGDKDEDGFEIFFQSIHNELSKNEVELRNSFMGHQFGQLPLSVFAMALKIKLDTDWIDADADFIRNQLTDMVDRRMKEVRVDRTVFEEAILG